MKFGEKLRKARTDKMLTQEELAKKVGVSITTIGNYESCKIYPKKREVYAKLAEVLGISVNELYNENDEFIMQAQERFGYTGRKQAEALADEMGGLFAGGEMSDDDLDAVMRTLQDYYWKAKEDNKKYGRRKSSEG